MKRRTAVTLAAALALAGGAAPGTALADDASVTAAVERMQRPTVKAMDAFERAAKTLGDKPGEVKIKRLQRATRNLRANYARYIETVGDEQASTPAFRRARAALLRGLRRMRSGLGTYDRALTQWLGGADDRTVKRTIESAMRRFEQSHRAAGSALDVLLPDDSGGTPS